jgi:hypothetical protein
MSNSSRSTSASVHDHFVDFQTPQGVHLPEGWIMRLCNAPGNMSTFFFNTVTQTSHPYCWQSVFVQLQRAHDFRLLLVPSIATNGRRRRELSSQEPQERHEGQPRTLTIPKQPCFLIFVNSPFPDFLRSLSSFRQYQDQEKRMMQCTCMLPC